MATKSIPNKGQLYNTKYYEASKAQSELLITRELERMQKTGVTSSASGVIERTPQDENIPLVSNVVLYKEEGSDDFKMAMEFYEQPKNSWNKALRTDHEGNSAYNCYTVSQEQLEAYIASNPDKASQVYDVLADYAKNDDINVRFGPDHNPYRWGSYSDVFSAANKPADPKNFNVTETLAAHKDAINEVYDDTREAYFKDHEPIRVGFTVTPCPINEPVRIRDANLDLDHIYEVTGIAPKIADRNGNVIVDAPQPPFNTSMRGNPSTQDHYIFDRGYQMIPVIAQDEKTPKEVRSNPVPNPYLVNYRMKGMGDVKQTQHHDLLIDPQYMTKLIDKGEVTMDASKKRGYGVVNTTVYYHDHYAAQFTSENNLSISVKNIRNQALKGTKNDLTLAECNRPAVPVDKLVGPNREPAPKHCVATLAIVDDRRPEGNDCIVRGVDYSYDSKPSKPFDFDAYKKMTAISVDAAIKAKANNQAVIKSVTAKGNEIAEAENNVEDTTTFNK